MERAGQRFRELLKQAKPLQIVGAVNAYSAMLARDAGHHALYLSGAGVANASYGLPDLGVTTLSDVLVDVRRILSAVDLPMLVDIDTGWGGHHMVQRAIRELEAAGVAAVHIEDQVGTKRCGHRPDKKLVSIDEMCARIEAAVEAREESSFVIMARTDGVAVEGLDQAIKRAQSYKEAGADMLFPEALCDLSDYSRFKKEVGIPVLANITEFGKTPLFTRDELQQAGVDMALYPLSAFRAMSKAALNVYQEIETKGTQKGSLSHMQTREELYEHLGYYKMEKVHG